MKQKHFQDLGEAHPHVVGVKDLVQLHARTLLFGRTAAGRIWHVYLDEAGTIHRLAYDPAGPDSPPFVRLYGLGAKGDCTESTHYVRHKLLYPERCDYEFCRALLSVHCQLQFAEYPKDLLGVPHRLYAPFVAPTLQTLLIQGAQFSTCELELRDAGYMLGASLDRLDVLENAPPPALPLAWALAA